MKLCRVAKNWQTAALMNFSVLVKVLDSNPNGGSPKPVTITFESSGLTRFASVFRRRHKKKPPWPLQ